MGRMVRKQVYIEAEQDRLWKSKAQELGVTESDLIRRGIDQLTHVATQPLFDSEAGQRIVAYLDELDRRFGDTPLNRESEEEGWRRDDAYAERLGRFLG